MKTSDSAIEKIKEFEGCELRAYKCGGGVWTIGYGHTRGVQEGMVISKADADNYLREDLKEVERQVEGLGEWTQGQFDALVSFVFNLGIESLKRSTLLKIILADYDHEKIKEQFLKWVYVNGKRSNGLIKRRTWESERFFS